MDKQAVEAIRDIMTTWVAVGGMNVGESRAVFPAGAAVFLQWNGAWFVELLNEWLSQELTIQDLERRLRNQRMTIDNMEGELAQYRAGEERPDGEEGKD